ncbi:hypothetical protein ACX9R5_06305 [Rathayibacter sp. CAU 1779]
MSQCLFGIVRDRLAPSPMTRFGFALEVVCWNVGSAAVIVGGLAGMPPAVATGSALLVVVLVRQLLQLRYRIPGLRRSAWLYGIVVAVLLVSIPTGIVLSAVRP